MSQIQRVTIRRAQPDDLDAIMAIEEASFRTPWPRSAMAEELRCRPGVLYLAAEVDGQVVGYTGMWVFAGEAHIMNLAVDQGWRRRGIGEALLLALLERARRMDARLAYLECRPSNSAAIALYAKLGFHQYGRRAGYYADNGEDALLMHLDCLDDIDFGACWDGWERRFGPRPRIA